MDSLHPADNRVFVAFLLFLLQRRHDLAAAVERQKIAAEAAAQRSATPSLARSLIRSFSTSRIAPDPPGAKLAEADTQAVTGGTGNEERDDQQQQKQQQQKQQEQEEEQKQSSSSPEDTSMLPQNGSSRARRPSFSTLHSVIGAVSTDSSDPDPKQPHRHLLFWRQCLRLIQFKQMLVADIQRRITALQEKEEALNSASTDDIDGESGKAAAELEAEKEELRSAAMIRLGGMFFSMYQLCRDFDCPTLSYSSGPPIGGREDGEATDDPDVLDERDAVGEITAYVRRLRLRRPHPQEDQESNAAAMETLDDLPNPSEWILLNNAIDDCLSDRLQSTSRILRLQVRHDLPVSFFFLVIS